eukprot:4183475-Alexandrium_andersonii.AAC.1
MVWRRRRRGTEATRRSTSSTTSRKISMARTYVSSSHQTGKSVASPCVTCPRCSSGSSRPCASDWMTR